MSEEQAVQAVVHLYVDGMTFAHAGALRKAFHPKASIIGNYQGSVEWLTLDEFMKAKVAGYKRPRGYRIWDELPKSGPGKILRREVRDRLREETREVRA